MSNTIEQIDVTKLVEKEDFETLFTAQVDLTPEEIEKLHNFYYPFYIKFIESGVPYDQAWYATTQLFLSQEPEIVKRQQNGNN